MNCVDPTCDGTLSGGWCDTCGLSAESVPPTPAAGAPTGRPASSQQASSKGASATPDAGTDQAAAPPVETQFPDGGTCPEIGCGGTVQGGWCDTCGMAATPPVRPITPASAERPAGSGPGPRGRPRQVERRKSRPSAAKSARPSSAPVSMSFGAPQPPSSRAVSNRSGSGSTRRSKATTRTELGAGYVRVAPTQVGNPADAVMSAEDIQRTVEVTPEEERFCRVCESPVGRGRKGKPGRIKGFCPSCRSPFDCATNTPGLTGGELVGGQYEVLGPIAHGGMGWIYLARDQAVSGRWVVLKGLLNESDPLLAAAAVTERQFLAQIEHGSIVNIYNFVTHQGSGYIVMEFVGGESLGQKLKARRRSNGGTPHPLDPRVAIAYVLGVLPALRYLHGLELVYNDLKPANIMATGDTVKLIDVGAVMRIDDQTADIYGTDGFRAPEVETLGPSVASDVYTIGRTLAVMILNFVYHKGDYRHELPSPAAEPLFARFESLYRFLLKATAGHPDDRFASVDELEPQLRGVLRELTAIETEVGRPEPSERFTGDRLSARLAEGIEDEWHWSILPSLRQDTSDPAIDLVADFGDEVLAPGDARRAYDELRAAVTDAPAMVTDEMLIALSRLAIMVDSDPAWSIDQLKAKDPWDWRPDWCVGIHSVARGDWVRAGAAFSDVWTALPGEVAPRLGIALAAEANGDFERSAQLYEQVRTIDPSFISATFGLARVRGAAGRADEAVATFAQVPAGSAARQVGQRRAIDLLCADPSREHLERAARVAARLTLDPADRSRIAVQLHTAALGNVDALGLPQPLLLADDPAKSEADLRRGLEAAHRALARQTDDPDLAANHVDQANATRPWSLL